jgi:hypothetical protein
MNVAAQNQPYIFPAFGPKPNQALGFSLVGSYAACGCAARCGCTPMVPKIPPQYHIPNEAQKYLSLQELNEFVDKFNHILETNYIPVLPLIFTHFCIPFSPICVMSWYAQSRDKLLNELVKIENDKMVGRKCHW